MDFRGNCDEGEMDTFMSIMKTNTEVECRIIQLKSFINNLKNELSTLDRKIEEEGLLHKRLSSEADINQSFELQSRIRISNLNESTQLTAKLCTDLFGQLSLEKKRCVDTKNSYDNSIKNELAKWDEYQKFYQMFPMVEKVEQAAAELKKVEIEKHKMEAELEAMNKKIEMRESLRQQRLQIIQSKVDAADLLNKELKEKKEILQNKKAEQQALIEDMKKQKSELLKKFKVDTANVCSTNLKRTRDYNSTNFGISSSQPNIARSTVATLMDFELPQLPRLQLLQNSATSRKIRRIDMVDTTLQRPGLGDFIQSKASSQSALSLNKTSNSVANISNIKWPKTAVSQRVYKSNNQGTLQLRVNTQGHADYSGGDSNDTYQIEEPQQTKKSSSQNAPPAAEVSGDSSQCNSGNASQDEWRNSGIEEATGEDSSIINKEKDVGKESQSVNQENVDHIKNSVISSGKSDDGYYSQSQSMSTQSQLSQQSLSQMAHASQKRKSNASTRNLQSISIDQHKNNEDSHQQEEISTSLPVDKSEESQSPYFTARKIINVSSVPPTLITTNKKTPFKSPPPRRSVVTSKAMNLNPPGTSCNVTEGPAYNNKRDDNVSENIQNLKNIESSNKKEEYFASKKSDNLMSAWMNSPSPPRGGDMIMRTNSPNENISMRSPANVSAMTSPPEIPAFNESYLNLLSPPGPQLLSERPTSSTPSAAELQPSMNMFGGSNPQQTSSSGGFSFTSKPPSSSSFFSMFK